MRFHALLAMTWVKRSHLFRFCSGGRGSGKVTSPFCTIDDFQCAWAKVRILFFAEVRFSLCFGAFVDFRVVVVWGFSFCCGYKEDL